MSSPEAVKHQTTMNNWFFYSEHSNAHRRCLPESHGYPDLSKLMLVTTDTSRNLQFSLFMDDTEVFVQAIEYAGWSLSLPSQCQHGHCGVLDLTVKNYVRLF